jgi:pilus assembly protein Flp/PilA
VKGCRAQSETVGDLGASGVEYGLMIAAVAAMIVTLIFVVGAIVKDQYQTSCTNLHSQMGGDDCPP